jgi:2-dehydro-3-deoxygalactonokinase
MEDFLSCDWGTSSFRLRLVEAKSQAIRGEILNDQGIAPIHRIWLKQDLPENKRLDFYLDFLKEQIATLEKKSKVSLNGIPVVLSGMATSSIGMMALGYASLPLRCEPQDLLIKTTEPIRDFPHSLIFISGARTENDVMRGEETMLIGCDADSSVPQQHFIFPGTHSKHVLVEKGMITDFKTYMTGEIFELLAGKSILAASLPAKAPSVSCIKNPYFDRGVHEGMQSNLLHAAFEIRTNQLFGKLTPDENYFQLSGLLIGNELSDFGKSFSGPVTLVCSSRLKEYYAEALRITRIPFRFLDADEALIRGQYRVAAQIAKSFPSTLKL